MNRWLEILLPVILTGLGAVVFALFTTVSDIVSRQDSAAVHIDNLQTLKAQGKEHEARLRDLTRRTIILENTTCDNCRTTQ